MPLISRWFVQALRRIGLRGAGLAVALLALPMAANALCILGCSCNTTITNIVFPNYNPIASGDTDSTGTIKVDCAGGVGLLVPYTVAISAGNSGSFSPRKMQSGSNVLLYNIFNSVTYLGVIGDGSGSSSMLSGGIVLSALGISTPQTWTLYGRIPGSQTTVVPGTFTDTLTVTLTYY